LFNDIFAGDNDQLKLGIDYVTADRTPNQQTDGRFGVSVTSKINDRITVNGKVGVPIGGINESTVVGDVEVQYRVNEDGTLNLRVFNKENEITYIGQGIGYTQGVGISYEVDFDTFKELVNKVFKNAKLNTVKATKASEVHDDSTPVPDDIHIVDKREEDKKKKSETAPNTEAIPSED
jgi:hypothetical protein